MFCFTSFARILIDPTNDSLIYFCSNGGYSSFFPISLCQSSNFSHFSPLPHSRTPNPLSIDPQTLFLVTSFGGYWSSLQMRLPNLLLFEWRLFIVFPDFSLPKFRVFSHFSPLPNHPLFPPKHYFQQQNHKFSRSNQRSFLSSSILFFFFFLLTYNLSLDLSYEIDILSFIGFNIIK
jgi:hypothetical protein